jgi:DNA/RNA endonuclease YhcR with UshA esterase domain
MDEGQIVTVTGRLLDLVGDTWQRLWLDDGTGQVLVFLPQRVAEYIPADLQTGQQLRVTGEVDIYDGEVEIIPLAGCDVERP